MSSKTCSKCKKLKLLSEFHRNRDGKNGLQSQCKLCKRAYCKTWRDKNRVHSRETSRSYHARNRAKVNARRRKWYYESGRASVLTKAARQRARKLNVPFSLTKEWVEQRLQHGKCEITGLPFVDQVSKGAGPYSPSIDREVPELGYTPENARLVLFALNVAMRNWGLDVVREIACALPGVQDAP